MLTLIRSFKKISPSSGRNIQMKMQVRQNLYIWNTSDNDKKNIQETELCLIPIACVIFNNKKSARGFEKKVALSRSSKQRM